MKQEISCGVIRDLLPLYEDGAASEESQELVREHLKDCPDCREELRKMRVPVSVPPDSDEDAMKRFLEHQAEVRRKQKVKAACVAVPLALIALLCLCYLWPRSWARFAGTEEAGTVSANVMELYFEYQDGEEIPSPGWHFWNLDVDGDSAPAQALFRILDDVVLHPRISNLRNYTPFPRESYTVTGAGSHVGLYLFSQDKQDWFYVTFYNNGVVTLHANSGCFVYGTRENPYDRLAALVKEYGEFRP